MMLRLLQVRFVRYGIVGVVGTLIHVGILIGLVEFMRWHPVVASTAGFIVSLHISFILNRHWTFDSQGDKQHVVRMFLKYCAVSIIGLLLNTAIMYIAVEWLTWHYIVGQGMVIIIVPLVNYAMNSYWTFGR